MLGDMSFDRENYDSRQGSFAACDGDLIAPFLELFICKCTDESTHCNGRRLGKKKELLRSESKSS